MLVVILDRALTGEEYDLILDWADESYDHLEAVINWVESSERTTDQNAIEDCLNLFKKDLMELCVDLLYRFYVLDLGACSASSSCSASPSCSSSCVGPA